MSALDLQALLDREAIRDCLYRYCRGIDRCDPDALRSVYWPDATDRHGAYQGSATGFVEYALVKLPEGGRMIHQISNILIELHGSVAAVESWWTAFREEVDADGKPLETLLCGRYVDRFEKRDGEWRVAARTVVYDWKRQTTLVDGLNNGLSPESFGPRQPTGARHPEDPVYVLLADVRGTRA